jgi:TM2 domain-containing membrane protein YozV
MNCVNHPEVPAAAYCQNCGKALCTECLSSVGGVVYCEPCLTARLSSAAVAGAPIPGLHANPMLAGLLGFIPGVGAMYNGQYVKALAHVLIFAVFVGLSDRSFVFGLLIAAWVFYQVFDAAQTAKARRDGLPLPNPFGLNDLGTRLGMTSTAPYGAGVGSVPPPPPGPSVQGFAPGSVPPPPGYVPPGYTPPSPGYTPVNVPPIPPTDRQHTPVGAIVLIAVGLVLLLQTLGIFEQEWISRAWPLIIIGIGGWLLYRRTRGAGL